MAKVKLNTTPDEINHYNRIERDVRDINNELTAFAGALVTLGYLWYESGIGKIVNGVFKFPNFPKVKELQKATSVKIWEMTTKGICREWSEKNGWHDAGVKRIFPTLPDAKIKPFMNHNTEALTKLTERKINGLRLSDRVWKITEQTKTEMQYLIAKAVNEGTPANELKLHLQRYLKNPHNFLPPTYNPGRGVYRSAVKNAERLARSEINRAFRLADHERRQQLPFVVGQEIRRSNNYSDCPVCESLKGIYPKDFVFTNWHPSCMCSSVSVLMSVEELGPLTEGILAGREVKIKSVNEVSAMNENAKRWWQENKHRIKTHKNLPHFIQDNEKFFKQ